MAVNKILKSFNDVVKYDAALSSEKIGNYSYTLNQSVAGGSITVKSIMDNNLSELGPYIRRDVL